MPSSSSLAGQRCLQWFFCGIEFCCSVVLLGIYSYWLATMLKHQMAVPNTVKAIEGISAFGTLYTMFGLLLICRCAGHPGPSFIFIVLAAALAGSYIYVAVANRIGATSCSGSSVNSIYGSGSADTTPNNEGGLPTYRQACQMGTACLVASCVAAFFFILSIFLEIHLNRSRYRSKRPLRDADGEYLSKSDYYHQTPPQRQHKAGVLGGAFQRFRGGPVGPANPDMLPAHQQVSDMQTRRIEMPATWGEVSSLHDSDRLYFNDGSSRDEHGPPVRIKSTTAPRPAAEEYNEGDIGDRAEELYQEEENYVSENQMGKGRSRSRRHREDKAARIERLQAAYS